MNKNEAIIIFRANNGYYIKPYQSVFEPDETIELNVFSSISDMEDFLEEHFKDEHEEQPEQPEQPEEIVDSEK